MKVFISYSSTDRAEALAVRRLLVNRGCTVWLDVFDIRVSAELKTELGEGVGNADVLCLLLSPTAVASAWVAEEIARGQSNAAGGGPRFVVVLLRPCRPPDTILGRVMIDATTGIASPDVSARVVRAVMGPSAVDDMELDAAMQEALAARQSELEAALVLPELAAQLDDVREVPIRQLQISFRQEAVPVGRVLAITLTFDTLFSQPMRFLFAHYREGRTWPRWMTTTVERDHHDIRSDGKRIDGRFQWFDHTQALEERLDGTELRDLPATFDVELSGESFRPRGSIASYAGGPTVPHLPQTLEIPALSALVEKRASFGVALLGPEDGMREAVAIDENDLDLRIVGTAGEREITLYRSMHAPMERAVFRGAFLTNRETAIEREAIFGLYERPRQLATAERERRQAAAFALLEKAEDDLSPEERRLVGRLHFGRATLEMFRVFASAPRPGPAREALYRRAVDACVAVGRIFGPLVAQDQRFDDVGMVFRASSDLARFYSKQKVTDVALLHAEAAVEIARAASSKDPDEPDFRRWHAGALARLADVRAASGDVAAALTHLDAGVEIWKTLCDAAPTPGRHRDLQEALEAALRSSGRWLEGPSAERERWAGVLGALEATQSDDN